MQVRLVPSSLAPFPRYPLGWGRFLAPPRGVRMGPRLRGGQGRRQPDRPGGAEEMAEREDPLGLPEEGGTGCGTHGTHGAKETERAELHKTI